MALFCCIFPFFHSWRYCIVTKIVLEFYVNGLIALSVKTALPPHYLKIIAWADKYQMTRSKYRHWYWGEVPCLCLWGEKCPNQTEWELKSSTWYWWYDEDEGFEGEVVKETAWDFCAAKFASWGLEDCKEHFPCTQFNVQIVQDHASS